MTTIRGSATKDRSGYDAYIRSAAWRKVRQRYITSKLPKVCAGCKKPWGAGDHLHHRTYKNFGNERLMDLVPLCQPCHTKVHALYDSDPKWRRKGLWFTTKAALKEPRVRRPRRPKAKLPVAALRSTPLGRRPARGRVPSAAPGTA